MELQDFVTETLVQIQEGVQKAIERRSVPGARGAINPVWGSANDISPEHRQEVEFDVAVSATDSSKIGGKAGIKVFSVATAEGERNKTEEQSRVSRVKFTVRVIPPVQLVEKL